MSEDSVYAQARQTVGSPLPSEQRGGACLLRDAGSRAGWKRECNLITLQSQRGRWGPGGGV